MKSKQIAQITPFIMNGHLIVSFDQKWIEVFNGIPVFDAIIDKDGKLCLIGPKIIKKGDK